MKGLRILMLVMCSYFLIGFNLVALPMNTPGYSWNNSSYWTLTDTDTTADDALFMITMENAYYESDFGLFKVDNLQNPTTVTKYKVFDASEEIGTVRSVYFKQIGNDWYVAVAANSSNWFAFDKVFGFYFDVYNESTPYASYYTVSSFNTPASEIGVQHILIEYNGSNNAYIYLDDQLANGSDRDWNDMKVFANDVAPVPEPATMLLLGSGLVGLAGFGRKKFFKKG